jgi:hypothetical protein
MVAEITGPVESVGILPWLQIDAPIAVGEIEFYPAAEAAKLLGARGAILLDRLRVYRDTWSDRAVTSCTVAVHHAQLTAGGLIPDAALRRAVDILLVAAAFKNDGVSYDANATTFTCYIQRLGGGEGFFAMHVRRRFGGIVTGAQTDIVLHKPVYAGTFSAYSKELLSALILATTAPDVWRLFDSLKWYRRASTDADNIDLEVDMVLLLTAVDFLLAHPNSPYHGLDQERMAQLLAPFAKIPCCSVIKNRLERSHIQIVLRSLDQVRNATVHPDVRPGDGEYGFQRDGKVAFALLADRCFMALLIARLIEMKCLANDDYMRAFVEGVERWAYDPSGDLGKIVLEVRMQHALKEKALELREKEIASVGLDVEPNEERKIWSEKFFAALGKIAEPWDVSLLWLKNGSGVLRLQERRASESAVRDYMPFSVSDDPVRMAYAALAWCDPDRLPTQDGDEEEIAVDTVALQNPLIWLRGDRHAL